MMKVVDFRKVLSHPMLRCGGSSFPRAGATSVNPPAAVVVALLGGGSTWCSTTVRTFSSQSQQQQQQQQHPQTVAFNGASNQITPRKLQELSIGYWTKPVVVNKPDGSTVLAFRTDFHPKLKPKLVAERLKKCKIYEGKERDIRGSEWKLNVVCQTIAGLPLEEAILQLQFMKKIKAPLVSKVLQRTSNLADIRDCLPKCALEVAECFATKGTSLKRINIMGRGRTGKMEHRFGHLRVILREIDFPLKIYQAHDVKQKIYWYKLQQRALQETNHRRAEREELQRLERENAEKLGKKK